MCEENLQLIADAINNKNPDFFTRVDIQRIFDQQDFRLPTKGNWRTYGSIKIFCSDAHKENDDYFCWVSMLSNNYPDQEILGSPIRWNTETNKAKWKIDLIRDTDSESNRNKPIFMFTRSRSPEPYKYRGIIKNSQRVDIRDDNRVFFESIPESFTSIKKIYAGG